MSQALYELPEGWKWERLKDVAFSIRNTVEPLENHIYHYVGLENIQSNTGVLIDFMPTDGKDISSTKVAFKKDSVLFGKLRPYLNKVYVAEFDGIATTEIIPFQCTNSLSPKFLAHYMRTGFFISWAMANCSGARMPRATSKFFDELAYVPLPPLAEQTRIVEKLDAVLSRIDTAIDELQQSLALVDAMFKSGLDGVFEDVYAHSAIKKLSELTTKIGSGATPKGGGSAYKESGISLIRSLNVHDLNFKYDGLAFIDDEQAKALSNVEVSSGDVLLNITGASIARCCIVPDGILPARVNQHVCILRPNHLLNSEFLNYLIVSPKFKSALLFQGAGGATRQALTKAMIENFDIPMPILDKQTEVIETIKQLNDKTTQLKTELTAKIGMFNQLKASVLDGAFRGEV